MKVTINELKKMNACREAIIWVNKLNETDLVILSNAALKENHFSWVNWYIVRKMNYKQLISYAIFAAEQVIDIFKKEHPNDILLQTAINSTKKCLVEQNEKNITNAFKAANAINDYIKVNIVHADKLNTVYAADAAVYATVAASDKAAQTIHTNYSTLSAYFAADAASHAMPEAKKTIIDYGIKLLEGSKK